MWDFIKYCLYCMCMTISAAFGSNPDGLNWETGITGVFTSLVLLCLLGGASWTLCFFSIRMNKQKILYRSKQKAHSKSKKD